MIAVLTCLGAQHDLRIVLMAAGVCCVGAYAAMRMFAHANEVTGPLRLGWCFLAAVVAGAAIWCTHFVAMLAYLVDAEVAYEPSRTIASLLIAIAGVYLGFVVASLEGWTSAAAVGGVIVGSAIALMHYVGMLAFRVDGTIRWAPGLVAASIASSALLSAAAMVLARGRYGARAAMGAPAALVLAILCLHFTGMAALEIRPLAPTPATLGSGAQALAIATSLLGLLVIGVGAVAYVIDERTQRDAHERVASLAFIDRLTGLPNSLGFEAALAQQLKDCEPGERVMVTAIGFPGIDAFKQRYSRALFEQATKLIVDRILQYRKPEVVLARSGAGRIFAFRPLPAHDDPAPRAQRLFETLSLPLKIGAIELAVDPRIGVAFYPDDGVTADALVKCATLALNRAIADPLEHVALFEPVADAATTRRQAIAEALRGALPRGEFELHYQPQVRIAHREIIGHEALLRWRHPTLGMVSPAEFIPIAEQTGLIVEIGEWTLHTACLTAATWPSNWRVAVNLSPLQLRQSNLVERVAHALERSGLAPERLELELTESLLIDDRARAQSILGAIRALKVRLALDDFGAGYSSMDVLRHFPFDKIKLDKTFVNDIEANPRSLAILHAMLEMGRSLSIAVLVEGVETERQLSILQAEGCVKVQGYLTGRPVSADKIAFLPPPPQRRAG